jgi:LPS export ABC transporter protein LptC
LKDNYARIILQLRFYCRGLAGLFLYKQLKFSFRNFTVSNMKRIFAPGVCLILLSLFQACDVEVDSNLLEPYLGPIQEVYDVNLYHSDSAIIRTHLAAKKQLEFGNGDQEFPEGIDITFFDKDRNVTTTMRADKGYYNKQENVYRGEGGVEVNNLEKEQTLASEELFWNPNTKKIYTDKFVTIQEKMTLFKGTGMEADESFSEYKLYKITDSRTILPGEN